MMEQFLVDNTAHQSQSNHEAGLLLPEDDDLDEYEGNDGNNDDSFQSGDTEQSSQLGQADDATE